MLQHVFTGKSSLEFLSSLCPSSLTTLAPWSSTLSVLLNEEGGIIDDMIITKHGEDGQGGQRFYVVTNAGRAEEDVTWITKKLEEWNSSEGKGKGKEVKWEKLEGYGLVALQGEIGVIAERSSSTDMSLPPRFLGPKAAETLQALTESDLNTLKFGNAMYAKVDGVECHIARGGYTGEDGFEVRL
jgi:aminomethyltransferase